MARSSRFIPVDSALHIMCRGNNRQKIFNNDSDKLYYWCLLKQLKGENNIDILHYCIMGNHIHLLVWLSCQSNLPKFMKQLNLSYFNYYKKLNDYCGHVWQGRYKSNIIETNRYLLHCGKYIELNPVRAGIVSLPGRYAFSSYKHYSLGHPDALISDSPAFLGLARDPLKRREQYVAFVVDNDIINADSLTHQAFIGSKEFIVKLRQYYGIKEVISKGGRPKKAEKGETPEASPGFEKNT